MRLVGLTPVDQREHRLAHGLGAPNSLVGCHPLYRSRYQLDGRIRRDCTVRHEECKGTRKEERACQTGQRLSSFRTPRTAVLHAERITQSASSLSVMISDAERYPSSPSVVVVGGVRINPGSELPPT
jgi:hypothetical protein